MGWFKSFWNKLTGKSGCCCCDCSGSSEAGACSAESLQAFVEYVAKLLVDAPEEVAVKLEENGDGRILRISCRKDDRGKIIGKHGKTITAIRSLVSGAAGRIRQRISVEVVD